MSRVRVVAEIGASHASHIENAKQLIYDAYQCGADMVKIQTFMPDQMTLEGITVNSGQWKGWDLYELYQLAQTPRKWHAELFDYAKHIGITLFSTPFSPSDVEFLSQFGVRTWKIASPEVDHEALWQAILATKPEEVIISLGCADEAKLRELRERMPGVRKTFLYCKSVYPVKDFDYDSVAHTITTYGLDGISDHSQSEYVAKLARLPITMIERHIKRNGDVRSLDSAFATPVAHFRSFVNKVRSWESKPIKIALGDPNHHMKRGWWKRQDGTMELLRPAPGAYSSVVT